MTKHKKGYLSPSMEVLTVQTEGVICQSINPTMLVLFSDWGGQDSAGSEMIQDKGYDF